MAARRTFLAFNPGAAMNYFKTSMLLACVALALTIMFGLPWIWRLATENGLWSAGASGMRGAAIGGCLFVAWSVVIGVWYLAFRQIDDAFENLGRVADVPSDDLQDVDEQLVMPPRASWEASVRAIQHRMADLAGEVRSQESDRSALELRARLGEAEQRRYASILRGLDEPILVVNEFDELILANPGAEQLLGFDSGAAVGQPLGDVIKLPEIVELLMETRRHKRRTTRTEEVVIEMKGGKAAYQITAWNLLEHPGWLDRSRDQSGHEPAGEDFEQRGAVAILHDISAEKKTQHRHAEFVAAVSHEMKTPLAGIRAYVEMLQDGDAEDDATRDEFLAVIESQAERLSRLVENLLNLARIESGVVKVTKSSHSLNEILEAASGVVRPAMEDKGNQLIVELSPLYLNVYVDRDQILQAAINLLTNANKYTAPGGKVRLRSRTLDKQVLLEVEDTGVGLSNEDCQKVFEKFYRVGKDKQMADGTGLGLPLAKSIVEDVHGGCLSVKSAPGKGSTFTITLPVAGQFASGRRDRSEARPASDAQSLNDTPADGDANIASVEPSNSH